jgi:hypothetical protein
MQLFYGCVPRDVVTFEVNIHYQYIYKHKIISIILITGTSSWSTLQHRFQKLRMVYLILKFCSAIEFRSSSQFEQKPVTWPQHQPVKYILCKLTTNFFWEPVQKYPPIYAWVSKTWHILNLQTQEITLRFDC